MDRDVRLRDLTADEYTAYRVHLRDGYVQEMVELGGRDRASAEVKADRESVVSLPPEGPATGQVIKAIEHQGQRIGVIWVGPAPDRGPDDPAPAGLAWLYDIEVEEHRRGQGWGHVLLGQAERLASELGFDRLGLNVFGGNERAIRLYQQDGYAVTSQQMAKDI